MNCGVHFRASLVVKLQNVLASWNDSVGQERMKASMTVKRASFLLGNLFVIPAVIG